MRERLTQGFPRGSDERAQGIPVLCLCTGANLARPVSLGRDQHLERVKVLIHKNLVFSPKEAGVISPNATVCLEGDALQIPCVPFVQHSLLTCPIV